MTELVFLVEEASIVEVLKVVVPQIVPTGIRCRFVAHEGKSDLEKSIPRKLRAWKTPGVQFVVVRDKDEGDCVRVKNSLLSLCKMGCRSDTLVRIVCHHLEAWFLGDLAAVGKAFHKANLAKRQMKRKYRDPDLLPNAEQELRKLVPEYQKLKGSRLIAPHLDLKANRSRSFHALLSGVQHLATKSQ